MKINRKSCAAKRRHAISKFRRAVSIKIMVEDNKKCNNAAECKRLKAVRVEKGSQ